MSDKTRSTEVHTAADYQLGIKPHSVGSIYPYSIKRIGDAYYQAFHCITGQEGPLFPLGGCREHRQMAHSRCVSWAKKALQYDITKANRERDIALGETWPAILADDRRKCQEIAERAKDKERYKVAADLHDMVESIGKHQEQIVLDRDDAIESVEPDPDDIDESAKDKALSEYSFILPLLSYFGKDHSFTLLEKQLTSTFGGFTKLDCSGQWRDDSGDIMIEGNVKYSVAVSEATRDELFALIGACKVRYEQDCVYVSKTADSVWLV